MGSQYDGSDTFPDDFTIPDDGDGPGAAIYDIPLEALGNRTRYLHNRVQVVGGLHPLRVTTDPASEAATADGEQLLLSVPVLGGAQPVVAIYVWDADYDVSAGDYSPFVVAGPSTVAGIGAWIRQHVAFERIAKDWRDGVGLANVVLSTSFQTISKVMNLNDVQVGDQVMVEAVVLLKVAADRGVILRLTYDDGVQVAMDGSLTVFDATSSGGSNTFAGYKIVTIKGAISVATAAPLVAVFAEGSFDASGSGTPEVVTTFIEMESYRP